MAPVQQFTQLLDVHRRRLAVIDDLPEEQSRALRDSGVLTVTHESTIKDGFGALESYLKARFVQSAPFVSLKGMNNVFQRLDEANSLYTDHLGVDLVALVGVDHWQKLKTGAALRHVLTHNTGFIDQDFRRHQPDWPQALGAASHH